MEINLHTPTTTETPLEILREMESRQQTLKMELLPIVQEW